MPRKKIQEAAKLRGRPAADWDRAPGAKTQEAAALPDRPAAD
ncbi:MAG: hypothetical protein ABSF12_16680 [Bryobacteraceae bacterium]